MNSNSCVKVILAIFFMISAPDMRAEDVEVIVRDDFEDGDWIANPAWETEASELYEVQDGKLIIPSETRETPIRLKLDKAVTSPIEVSFLINNENFSADGHWIMVSLLDDETQTGYSIAASEFANAFGTGTNTSGFAWGEYGKITTVGELYLHLNKDTYQQHIAIQFDPLDQRIVVKKDGEVVIDGYGRGAVEKINAIDIRTSDYPRGPYRAIDEFVVSSAESKPAN